MFLHETDSETLPVFLVLLRSESALMFPRETSARDSCSFQKQAKCFTETQERLYAISGLLSAKSQRLRAKSVSKQLVWSRWGQINCFSGCFWQGHV